MGNSPIGCCCPPNTQMVSITPTQRSVKGSVSQTQARGSLVQPSQDERNSSYEKGDFPRPLLVACEDELKDSSDFMIEKLTTKCEKIKLEDFSLLKVI